MDEDSDENPEPVSKQTIFGESSNEEEVSSNDEKESSPNDSQSESDENEQAQTQTPEYNSNPESENSEEEEERAEPEKSDDDNEEEDRDEDKTSEKGDDLFGDADDISSSDDNEAQPEEESASPKSEQARRVISDEEEIEDRDEVDQDDDGELDGENMTEQRQETRIEVEIPKITTDLGSSVHFVRFPNFLSVEARPFDPAVYEDEIEEDELLDEEGRTRLKLKVENTIRWRKFVDENGIELLESNARIIKWSDGSSSLHLGSEIFDVHQMSIQGDHNHLFIRQGTGLQGQAVFKTKLTFRPHSTKSATHKKMTNRLAMRHNQNQQKVRVLPIAGQDPESRKADLMKVEEGLLKAHVRREALKRRMREKSHFRGLSSHYVEEDDHGDSISAIKNEFKSGVRGRSDYNLGYESEEEQQKLLRSQRFISDDEGDDDDDDILGNKRKRDEDGEVRRKTYVVSDEDDDDDDDDQQQLGSPDVATEV